MLARGPDRPSGAPPSGTPRWQGVGPRAAAEKFFPHVAQNKKISNTYQPETHTNDASTRRTVRFFLTSLRFIIHSMDTERDVRAVRGDWGERPRLIRPIDRFSSGSPLTPRPSHLIIHNMNRRRARVVKIVASVTLGAAGLRSVL